jgi:hypothetical protein
MNETALNMGACSPTKESSTGEQLLSMARRIASEAEAMSKEAQDKLSPISRIAEPVVGAMADAKNLQQVWPPYFEEIRAILNDISKSVLVTQRTIKRVEL